MFYRVAKSRYLPEKVKTIVRIDAVTDSFQKNRNGLQYPACTVAGELAIGQREHSVDYDVLYPARELVR